MEVTLVREDELRRVIGLDSEGLEAIAEGFAKLSSGEVVLLNNGYLTDLRTGLAGAVAARLLAPATVTTVGILGSRAQARRRAASCAPARERPARTSDRPLFAISRVPACRTP